MDTTEFITLSFTLACTLGPLLGFSLAVGGVLLRTLDHKGFSVTVGKRPLPAARHEETNHVTW